MKTYTFFYSWQMYTSVSISETSEYIFTDNVELCLCKQMMWAQCCLRRLNDNCFTFVHFHNTFKNIKCCISCTISENPLIHFLIVITVLRNNLISDIDYKTDQLRMIWTYFDFNDIFSSISWISLRVNIWGISISILENNRCSLAHCKHRRKWCARKM